MNVMSGLLPVLSLFASLLPAFAGEWYVANSGDDTNGDGTSGSPFATLSKALSVATTNSEIRVQGGLYVENLIDATVNDVTILGGFDGSWTRDLAGAPTVVKAATAGQPVIALQGNVTGVRLGGLVLTGGNYGIKTAHVAGMVFEQLVISNNSAYAIGFTDTASDRNQRMVVASCLIAYNQAGIKEDACGWSAPWYIDVLSCTFLNNRGAEWSGNGYVTFRNNIFTRLDVAPSAGQNSGNLKTWYYDNCMAHGSAVETLYPQSVQDHSGNIYNPAAVNADGTLKDSSPCLKTGGDLSENAVHPVLVDLYGTAWNGQYDMGCIKSPYMPYTARDIHVATNGSDVAGDGTVAKPFATITKAISDFKSSDRILVQGGNYSENIVNTTVDDLVALGSYDADWVRDLRTSRTVITAADASKPVILIDGAWRNRWSGIDLTGGSDGLSVLDMHLHVFEQMKITGCTSAGIAYGDIAYAPVGYYLVFAHVLVADNGGYAIRQGRNNWGNYQVRWYNCTLAGNGSGTLSGVGKFLFRNCICHNPAGSPEFNGTANTVLDIGVCCVRDALYGNCNKTILAEPETITADPRLDGGFRLTETSLCNKRGMNLSDMTAYVATEDIEGVAWSGAYDIGCFRSAYPWVPGATRLKDVYVSTDGDDENDGSEGHPVATLLQGLDLTDAGGTCHVGPGCFCGGVMLMRPGMMLVGAGIDRTVVTNGTITINAQNVTVSGFSCRRCGEAGITTAGGGVATNAVIRDCVSSGNTYGISADMGADKSTVPVTIHHVICTNNTTAGLYARGDLLVYNSLFAANGSGASGDGVKFYEGGFRLYNCTIADNRAYALDVVNQWSRPKNGFAVNCILSGSTTAFIYPGTGPIGVFSNCLFNCSTDYTKPIFAETNCLHNVDPQFRMTGRAPYRLRGSSPACQAGLDLASMSDTLPEIASGLDGTPCGNRWDIGCYFNSSRGFLLSIR